jgi:hypothetical protein
MTIEQLAPLVNGFSLTACGQTMVLDRLRVRRISDRALEFAFLIAGTDLVPRLRLTKERFASSTWEDLSRIFGRVASRAAGCS